MSATATRRNAATGVVLAGVVAGMVGLAFASVPLYRLFCQVTGYGGTTQVADSAPAVVGDQIVTVRLDSVVNSSLPWKFEPVERQVTLRVGEERLVRYRATNLSDRAIVGSATFNVTPQKAGEYFTKIACFCFEEQRLEAGASVELPVSFFVDPDISQDPNLDDVRTITLTYTFFRAAGDAGRKDMAETAAAAKQ